MSPEESIINGRGQILNGVSYAGRPRELVKAARDSAAAAAGDPAALAEEQLAAAIGEAELAVELAGVPGKCCCRRQWKQEMCWQQHILAQHPESARVHELSFSSRGGEKSGF